MPRMTDMPGCIVYTSRTGNTRKVAEFLASRHGLPVMPVNRTASVPDSGILALGFWTFRGGPDPVMAAFMASLHGRDIFAFGTMGAFPDAQHRNRCLEKIAALILPGNNQLIGSFFCQGRVDPVVAARSSHPDSPERRHRLACAALHPDDDDLRAASARLAQAWEKMK